MGYIANFEKVSEKQWDNLKQMDKLRKNLVLNGESKLCEYDEIKLPTRATKHSAGYDFYSTEDFIVKPGESVVVNTGIKCEIDPNWVLVLCPKSGLGFKYGMTLANTIGIVDADYYNSESNDETNEGHIMVKIHVPSESTNALAIKKGQKFCQGIFLQYGIAIENKDELGTRNGGIGSTGK